MLKENLYILTSLTYLIYSPGSIHLPVYMERSLAYNLHLDNPRQSNL